MLAAYKIKILRMPARCCLSLQASINELEVVIDESNAQIASLREQLSAAQQRRDLSEADGTSLQSTIATLQQEVQAAQVRLHDRHSCPNRHALHGVLMGMLIGALCCSY